MLQEQLSKIVGKGSFCSRLRILWVGDQVKMKMVAKPRAAALTWDSQNSYQLQEVGGGNASREGKALYFREWAPFMMGPRRRL